MNILFVTRSSVNYFASILRRFQYQSDTYSENGCKGIHYSMSAIWIYGKYNIIYSFSSGYGVYCVHYWLWKCRISPYRHQRSRFTVHIQVFNGNFNNFIWIGHNVQAACCYRWFVWAQCLFVRIVTLFRCNMYTFCMDESIQCGLKSFEVDYRNFV